MSDESALKEKLLGLQSENILYSILCGHDLGEQEKLKAYWNGADPLEVFSATRNVSVTINTEHGKTNVIEAITTVSVEAIAIAIRKYGDDPNNQIVVRLTTDSMFDVKASDILDKLQESINQYADKIKTNNLKIVSLCQPTE